MGPVISTARPSFLFHGTTWRVLDEILAEGIKPMSRNEVHLSNSIGEATEVGSRHGKSLVLKIDVQDTMDVRPVADGVWVTKFVPKERISIVNEFVEVNRRSF